MFLTYNSFCLIELYKYYLQVLIPVSPHRESQELMLYIVINVVLVTDETWSGAHLLLQQILNKVKQIQ